MINWISTKVKIKDLKDYEHNPRKITKKDFEKLVKSLQEDGYHQRLVVNKDLTIIGGHQRKKALLQAGFKPSDEIEVLMSEEQLSAEQLDRINIRDNLPYGGYDFDILANRFDPETLIDFGMPEEWLSGPKIEMPEIAQDFTEKQKCTCDCCKH